MCTPDTSSSMARLEEQVLGSFLRTRAVAQSLWIEKLLLIIHVCMLQTPNKSVTLVKLPNPVSLLPPVHVYCAWQIDTKSGRSCTLHGAFLPRGCMGGTRRMHSSPNNFAVAQSTGTLLPRSYVVRHSCTVAPSIKTPITSALLQDMMPRFTCRR